MTTAAPGRLATGGDVTQAALLLGIDRETLHAKMEPHGLAAGDEAAT